MKSKLFAVLIIAAGVFWYAQPDVQRVVATADAVAPGETVSPDLKQLGGDNGARPVVITSSKAPVSGEVAQRLRWLSNKIIKTSAEQSEWEDLLSNPRSLAAAADRLKHRNENLTLDADQRERLDAGLVLIRALEWKANPSASRAVAQVEDLINDTTLDAVSDLAVKRSLAADRIELFVVLRETHPAVADRIVRHASGLQARLIEFAINNYAKNN